MEIDFEILLNLPFLRINSFTISDKVAHINCESILETGHCPSCMLQTKSVINYQERTIRDMALLGREVYLHLRTRQFHCQSCNRYFNERFSFVEPSKTLTIRYEKYLYKMCENICISDVSTKEDISWLTINELHKRYANKELASKDSWSFVKILGIDEISVRKGKKNYACCLVDLERGIVLDFLEDRKKETLIAYFKAKGSAFCHQIEVVSSDMWDAYSTLAGDLFPNAFSVIDRFHFFMHISKALDGTRKLLRKEFPDEKCYINLRWALLKNPINLDKDESDLLKKAFNLSSELASVYSLRQELKLIFDSDLTKKKSEQKLKEWEDKAQKTANKFMIMFLKTLNNWRDKILNFFHMRHTNAVVEGLNNAIRGIIRRSFGFQSFDNLKRRVLTELG